MQKKQYHQLANRLQKQKCGRQLLNYHCYEFFLQITPSNFPQNCSNQNLSMLQCCSLMKMCLKATNIIFLPCKNFLLSQDIYKYLVNNLPNKSIKFKSCDVILCLWSRVVVSKLLASQYYNSDRTRRVREQFPSKMCFCEQL